jgi:hypothetical protein
VEGSSRGIFQGTIPEFAWRDWGKPCVNIKSGWPVFRPRFEEGLLQNVR